LLFLDQSKDTLIAFQKNEYYTSVYFDSKEEAENFWLRKTKHELSTKIVGNEEEIDYLKKETKKLQKLKDETFKE
jgi:hypothetical protein